jgi:hypothetical protein
VKNDTDGTSILLDATMQTSIQRDESVVHVLSRVHYVDVFGDYHTTEIHFEYSGDQCIRSGKPRLADAGHNAT